MCDICRQIPCDARCPNAKDEVGDVECRMCKLPINKGDRYLPTPEGNYCIECLKSFSMWEWLGVFGEELEEA